MTETRDFPTEVMASISTGVMLCAFDKMHEAAEWLMGHPIWTHQFASRELASEMGKTVLEQCPGIPTATDDVNETNYKDFIAKLHAEIGPTVRIRKGGGLTAMLPTDGIPDHLKDHTIMIAVPQSEVPHE